MKIAQVAPLYESVPPRAYGGTERVVSYLTEALVEMGHEVTLFASGDSITSARLASVVPRGLRLDPRNPDPLVWHTIMMDMVLKAAASFDVIHFHTDVLQLALVAHCETPCLSTAHGRLDLPDLKPLFRCFPGTPWCRSPRASARRFPGSTGVQRCTTGCRWTCIRRTRGRRIISLSSGASRPRSAPTGPSRSPGLVARHCASPPRWILRPSVFRVHDKTAAGRSTGELCG